MTTTIADHLQNLAHGDEDAWAHVYKMLAEDVLRTAYRLTGDQHLAQDVAQEVFLDLKRSAGRFRRPTDPAKADAAARAWVGGIAVKTTLYLARTQRNRRRRDRAVVPVTTTSTDPGDELAVRDLLRRGLTTLPVSLASAVSLRHLEGYSYEEIATLDGCSVGNARVRCSRGLKHLRRWCKRSGVLLSLVAVQAGLAGAADAGDSWSSVEIDFSNMSESSIPTTVLHGNLPGDGMPWFLLLQGCTIGLITVATVGFLAWGRPAVTPKPEVSTATVETREPPEGSSTHAKEEGRHQQPDVASVSQREPTPESPLQQPPAKERKIVPFHFDESPFAAVYKHLTDEVGLVCRLDPRLNMPDLPAITLKGNMYPDTLIQWVAMAAGLGVEERDGVYVFEPWVEE